MSDSPSPMPTDPKKALMTIRIIWGALINGLVVLTVVITVVNASGPVTEDAQIGGMVAGAAGLLLLLGAPIGLFLRGQAFKRHWKNDAVTPEGYSQGCLMAWAPIEAASTVGLVAVLLGGSLWPFGLPTAAGIGLLLALWPNGKAMQPAGPVGARPDAAATSTAESEAAGDRSA